MKRKSNYVEKKQCTIHRWYSQMSHNIGLTMKFSLKVANYVLQQSLTTTTDGKPKNDVCSPISIDIVLNMVALGAKCPTLDQLMELLGFDDGVYDSIEVASVLAGILKQSKYNGVLGLSSVNALFVDQLYTLDESFRKVVRDLHNAQSKAVDFTHQAGEVVKEVNKWAQKESKGLIKELISQNSLSNKTVMLLVNALYFKGTWVEKFKPKNTEDGDFYLLNGEKIQVPLMNKFYTNYDYGTFEGCQILRMLYEEEEQVPKDETKRSFAMYIFLPNTKDGLPNLLNTLQLNSRTFKDNIELTYEKISTLSIPKFKFECEHSLVEPMKKMGLTLPFDEYCMDLSKIIECSTCGEEKPLYISGVAQKCRVETDEEGTKAAAFTKVSKFFSGGAFSNRTPPRIDFVADHPFLFMIREDISGALLFVGTMLNPLQG